LQYTRDLLSSDVVSLMSLVVCRIRPSINAAFNKMADTLTVTKEAVYDKIDRVETSTSAALVRHAGTAFTAVVDALGGRKDPWLAGYRTRILDGSHLPGTEHRIAPLRATRAGALPGQSLVIFEPESMLVLDVILCEDGHAQERSMTEEILALVGPQDLWIADRNFGTTSLLFGIAARGGSFVIRQHGSTLTWEAIGNRVSCGRCETGAVFEQKLGSTNDAGEIFFVRRVTVELGSPTRDGDRGIHILSNLSAEDADAIFGG
jgi:hypothetical protein